MLVVWNRPAWSGSLWRSWTAHVGVTGSVHDDPEASVVIGPSEEGAIDEVRLPEAFGLTTKASLLPLIVVSNAPGVVGKSVDDVRPDTTALPVLSTAILKPMSGPEPPR